MSVRKSNTGGKRGKSSPKLKTTISSSKKTIPKMNESSIIDHYSVELEKVAQNAREAGIFWNEQGDVIIIPEGRYSSAELGGVGAGFTNPAFGQIPFGQPQQQPQGKKKMNPAIIALLALGGTLVVGGAVDYAMDKKLNLFGLIKDKTPAPKSTPRQSSQTFGVNRSLGDILGSSRFSNPFGGTSGTGSNPFSGITSPFSSSIGSTFGFGAIGLSPF